MKLRICRYCKYNPLSALKMVAEMKFDTPDICYCYYIKETLLNDNYGIYSKVVFP